MVVLAPLAIAAGYPEIAEDDPAKPMLRKLGLVLAALLAVTALIGVGLDKAVPIRKLTRAGRYHNSRNYLSQAGEQGLFSFDAVQDLIHSEDDLIRANALVVMANMKDERALSVIVEEMQDSRPFPFYDVSRALQKRTGMSFDTPEQWKEWLENGDAAGERPDGDPEE